MSDHLTQAKAFEEADDLANAARHYALAFDQNEAADSAAALHAALTFFEAKDNLPGRIAEDPYHYFTRWIDVADELGCANASFWRAYDAMVYGDGPTFPDQARDWLSKGATDALLTLAIEWPEQFGVTAADFVKTLRPLKTYRERYLYSILGQPFDKAN